MKSLDNLLSILSTKLPYQLKIAKVNEFLEDLASKYLTAREPSWHVKMSEID